MNVPLRQPLLSLDQLPLRQSATVAAVDWDALGLEGRRLRELGFDEGVTVEPLHHGFLGRDPIACRVGRMTVALRRLHAQAVSVRLPS